MSAHDAGRRLARALDVPLLRFLGVSAVDLQDSRAGVSMPPTPNAMNAVEAPHAGVLSTILEVAAYLALLPELSPEEEAVSHAISIAYVSPHGRALSMVFAADYPLLNVIWTMCVFFGFLIWISLLFTAVADLLRRRDMSGWAKGGWLVLMIVFPYLGVFAYFVVHSAGIADRQVEHAERRYESHVRASATNGGATAEIERAKRLLDSGGISQAEFETLKAKALA